MFRARGDRPEWRIIYDEARTLNAGDVLTYERLSELLGRDFRAGRAPLQRAMQELENADSRTLACVRGVGYRIAAATEHETLAHKHSARSRRQLNKAVAKVRSADRSQLTPEQAQRLDALQLQYAQHADMLKRLDARDRARQAEIQKLRRDTTSDIAELNDQVTRLTEALQRHGFAVEPPASTSSKVPMPFMQP